MFINVYTLILRIFTDLHTCLQGSESIVWQEKTTTYDVRNPGPGLGQAQALVSRNYHSLLFSQLSVCIFIFN
jgi:hypothetical protein